MRQALSIFLCVLLPVVLFAGDNAYKVTYDGGSLADTKAGTGLKLYIESNQIRFVNHDATVVTFPPPPSLTSATGKMCIGESGRRSPWASSRWALAR